MATTNWTQTAGMTSDTEADNVEEFTEQAEASKNAAAASAAAAASSQTSATGSAIGAANSAASASSSATAAAASATSSASSAATASSAQTASEAAESAAQTAQAAAEAAQAAAETAETNAETAETNAETAQTAAEAAQASAEAAKDAIDGLYLGAQASDPTVDGLGAALTAGDWYYNTTSNIVRIYDGSAWVNGSVDGSLFATAAQGTLADSAVQPNDSPSFGSITVSGTVDGRDVATDGTKLDGIEAGADVTDTANVTAAGALMDSEVTNLAQVKAFDNSDYATAAQGALAASATQPGDLATVATSGAYGDLSGTPTLGTAAATASTDYATAAQGANADTAYGWGDHAAAGYTTPAAAESNALALAIALG